MGELIKLGEFDINGNKYVAAYNTVVDGVDYYYLNEEYNDVECWTIKRTALRKITGKKRSMEWFKKCYPFVWDFVFSRELDESIVSLQTFKREFWDNVVMKGFENMSISVVSKEEAEKLAKEIE